MFRRNDTAITAATVAFVAAWVFTLIASLVGTGLVIYILWRIATHPW
jgi:hypothetical protein